MTPVAVQSPRARQDLAEIAEYLRQRSARAAHRFLHAVEDVCAKLADMPGMGGLYETADPSDPALRLWPVPGFPSYLIFYLETTRGIEVVRVLHGGRELHALLPP
jgi:toxin ParE1/3/4